MAIAIGRLITAATIAVLTAAVAGCGSSKTNPTAARPTTSRRANTTTTPANRDGPYAIGRRDEVFVDTTRITVANGGLPERPSRTLETIIEYPARGTPDPNVETRAAPPAAGTFPVVLFVHGFSAHADNPYLHPLAAAGFVAVAIKFPLTNTDTPGGPAITDTFNEPADIRYVLSQLGNLPARDADLQRIVDARRVGILGQSLGAVVAYDMAYNSRYQDRQIAAVVAMSGGCVACWQSVGEAAGSYFSGSHVPVLFVHGTDEPFIPAQGARAYGQTPAPKYWLDLIGAHHVQYGPPWEAITAKATTDFFNQYLRNDTEAARRLTEDTKASGTVRLRQDAAA